MKSTLTALAIAGLVFSLTAQAQEGPTNPCEIFPDGTCENSPEGSRTIIATPQKIQKVRWTRTDLYIGYLKQSQYDYHYSTYIDQFGGPICKALGYDNVEGVGVTITFNSRNVNKWTGRNESIVRSAKPEHGFALSALYEADYGFHDMIGGWKIEVRFDRKNNNNSFWAEYPFYLINEVTCKNHSKVKRPGSNTIENSEPSLWERAPNPVLDQNAEFIQPYLEHWEAVNSL